MSRSSAHYVQIDGAYLNGPPRNAAMNEPIAAAGSAAASATSTAGAAHDATAAAGVAITVTGSILGSGSAAHNVSSITDNGTGDYTINFTTAFSGATYAPAGFGRSTGANYVVNGSSAAGPAAGSCRIRVSRLADESLADLPYVSFVAFGDQ